MALLLENPILLTSAILVRQGARIIYRYVPAKQTTRAPTARPSACGYSGKEAARSAEGALYLADDKPALNPG
jgi:hypothetical protein